MRALSLLCGFVFCITHSFAFDVFVHADPLSQLTMRLWTNGSNEFDCPDDSDAVETPTDLNRWIQSFQNKDEALRWLDELGVTALSVYQPDSLLSRYYPPSKLGDMNLINMLYPDRGIRYVQAQAFPVFAGKNGRDDWYTATPDTPRVLVIQDAEIDPSEDGFDPYLRVNESDGSGLIWRTTKMPKLNGWFWWDNIFSADSLQWTMPLNFDIVFDVTQGTCDTTTEAGRNVATLDFYVSWNDYDRFRQVGNCIDSIFWVRYSVPITTRDNRNSGAFDTLFARIDPYVTPVTLCNDSLQTLFTGQSCLLDSSDTLCFSHFFWHDEMQMAMRVRYEGCHTFDLYKVTVKDDAYQVMFDAPQAVRDSAVAEIRAACEAQIEAAGGRQIGWYADEWIARYTRPFSRFNKILRNESLPGFVVNGIPFSYDHHLLGDSLFLNSDQDGSRFEVLSSENYTFRPDSTCLPFSNCELLIHEAYTDSVTDRPYFSCQEDNEACDPQDSSYWGITTHFRATKSLQAAMDEFIWGQDPLEAYQPPSYPWPVDQQGVGGILIQTDIVHRHGYRHWTVVLGAKDGDDFDSGQGWNCGDEAGNGQIYRMSTPTPNEVKLQCWLSVACDADGLWWYPWMSGGLLEWDERDWCSGMSVRRTDNYYAAKSAISDIHELAPILESLEFVKTYASRAFELSYPNNGNSATTRDTLRNATYPSTIEWIRTYIDENGQLDWTLEGEDSTYVQVSRFKRPGASNTSEDYWFLVVNRRALTSEKRKVMLKIVNLMRNSQGADYVYERLLDGSSDLVYTSGENPDATLFVVLDPGEAELIHFMPLDTTDLVIHGDTTLKAPAYYNRNIILDNAKVTIVPDTAIQHYTYIKGTQIEDAWKDSLEILFAPGKGIRCLSPDSGYNKLSILGNDSTQIILKCSKGLDNRWKGIEFQSQAGDTLRLEYATITHADYPIFATGQSGSIQLSQSVFADNWRGVFSLGQREIVMDSVKAHHNDFGIAVGSGCILRVSDSEITNCRNHGIYAQNNCMIDLKNVVVSENDLGGILSTNSELRMACCKIEGNGGVGVDIASGLLTMADVGEIAVPTHGANWIRNNSGPELELDGELDIVMKNGHNVIYDSTGDQDRIWVGCRELTFSPDWSGNYWGGLNSDSLIWTHVDCILVDPEWGTWLRPDCTPALSELPEFCDLSETPTEDACVAGGLAYELQSDFSNAAISYQTALAASTPNCFKRTPVTKYVGVSYLGNAEPGTTTAYFASVLDTTQSSDTRLASMAGLGFSLANDLNDLDSAAVLYQTLIDSTGSNVYKKIDGQIGLLHVSLQEEESDTIDGLTSDDVTAYFDSLETILAQRFVWTQNSISDSVVMYAPTRVNNAISVGAHGVLTIVPRPGYVNPTVEFADNAYIAVSQLSGVKGELRILGTADNRIKLTSADSTLGRVVSSLYGIVRARHAIFSGKGIASRVFGSPSPGSSKAILQADSCVFELFDEGVLCSGTDSTSYVRGCTFSQMGGNPGQYGGYGAGLVLRYADGMLVEDCLFDQNEGVGIYQAYSNGVTIRNCTIQGGVKTGVYGASSTGGPSRLECCAVTNNGDTLPELWSLGVIFDLVGGHNALADSSGPLIKASDPSYVDLEDGENLFTLWGDGKYIQSGDTNDTWDVTWNTWEPSSPADSDFYDYMYPSNPAKWTIDSSLASYVGCDVQETSSQDGGNWLIVDPWDNPTIASEGPSGKDENPDISVRGPVQVNVTKADLQSKSRTSESRKSSCNDTKAAWEDRRKSRAMQAQMHHEELTEWRGIRDDAKYASPAIASRRAMNFVTENPQSEFVPAALSTMVSMSRLVSGDLGTSKFLHEVASTSKYDGSTRKLAKRLAFGAMAFEGNPQAGLNGLQEMMESFETPRDSLLALMDAMQLYFDYHQGGNLRPRYRQITVTDPYELVRRMIYLGEKLDDPNLAAEHETAPVPTAYQLYQNYPNPFNPNTEIRFDIPEVVKVELKIFNILGQEVTTLVDDVRAAGAYRILWDGKNAGGLSVASGVYVYQLKAGNFQDAKKMVLLR